MANETTPYIARNPGDLITAEDWNIVQEKIKQDIEDKVKEAIGKIESVKNAEDAAKLAGKTTEELTEEILERALQEIPARTGYLKIFKQLKVGEEKVIEHGLKACPLVDVYQLDYFEVVCAEDEQRYTAWVTFYLYHSSEERIRFVEADGTSRSIPIEPEDGHAYKIKFQDMLERYNVEYTEASSLGDLETEFWKAFFDDPNDRFDHNQYCHSPWFERCCREERTVESLKQRGDWDDLWFQLRPRRTTNYSLTETAPTPAPTQIQVVHFDFDTLGVKLLSDPVYPVNLPDEIKDKKELKVMLLLKV